MVVLKNENKSEVANDCADKLEKTANLYDVNGNTSLVGLETFEVPKAFAEELAHEINNTKDDLIPTRDSGLILSTSEIVGEPNVKELEEHNKEPGISKPVRRRGNKKVKKITLDSDNVENLDPLTHKTKVDKPSTIETNEKDVENKEEPTTSKPIEGNLDSSSSSKNIDEPSTSNSRIKKTKERKDSKERKTKDETSKPLRKRGKRKDREESHRVLRSSGKYNDLNDFVTKLKDTNLWENLDWYVQDDVSRALNALFGDFTNIVASQTCYVYLLIDSRIYRNVKEDISGNEDWTNFCNAIFYAGRGQGVRYINHPNKAKRNWPEGLQSNEPLIKRICEVWNDDKPLIILKVADHLILQEAQIREALLITARSTKNLANKDNGTYSVKVCDALKEVEKQILGIGLLAQIANSLSKIHREFIYLCKQSNKLLRLTNELGE